MNVYFSYFQTDPDNINWNQVIGMSNYELPIQQIYNYHRLFISKKRIRRDKILFRTKFFVKKKSHMIDFDKEVPHRTAKIEVEQIDQVVYPIALKSYESLESIKIVNCKLEGFPWKDIPNFLRELNLSHNNIAGNVNLSHTKNLRFIYLSNNRIENAHLPYDCNTVNLSHNCLKDVIFYNPMMVCDFSFNQLTDFQGSKWLENCDVSHNMIKQINLVNSLKLVQLNVAYNKLSETFSVTLFKLLNRLNISNNELNWIEGLENCGSLEILDASFNRFETLMVPKISQVNVSNNPLEYFEWHDISCVSGMSFSDVINGEKLSNPLFSGIHSMVYNSLNLNRVDELYSKDSFQNKQKSIDKKYVNMSNTKIQEFPEELDLSLNQALHVIFYENTFVNIPYHPRLYIHIKKQQAELWMKMNPDSKVKIEQSINQQFFTVDSE